MLVLKIATGLLCIFSTFAIFSCYDYLNFNIKNARSKDIKLLASTIPAALGTGFAFLVWSIVDFSNMPSFINVFIPSVFILLEYKVSIGKCALDLHGRFFIMLVGVLTAINLCTFVVFG